ncbi:GNAT family N-acetyltransferase [Streptomyces sp. AJS327]|uniref:GNAT family N-acetyltransferase n=1 Tax=Streptomyces sp. AJS327 TaxID=2545265 RepID=UPI0015DEA2E1|nr:GNAT family N-acetyltransferase [Streptomyces sp. AJS327]MBA0052138.1 GNAT family N-acetyltransferase [Streptomyces sp. AJS327]
MRISECRAEDVAVLDRHLPFAAPDSSHAARYARHRAGDGTFLVAWVDGRPAGSCEVRWTGCESPEVRAAHPGCPEISGLGVWPGALRSRGIGSALIGTAEELAVQRGHRLLGLGVEKNNPRAEALYKRLGYRLSTPYLDCWSYEDGDGVTHRVADARLFFVKPLDG